MALETAAYINSLNTANPPAGDPAAQSADHIRLLKGTLKSTFPNVVGPVTATDVQLSLSLVPTGGIILWSGAAAAVPTGYALCNGSTYSRSDGSGSIVAPDLRDRFVLGAGGSYAVSATGGATSGTTSAAGAHTPSGSLSTVAGHNHTGSTGTYALTANDIPAHTHNTVVTSNATGDLSANPTWSLAYVHVSGASDDFRLWSANTPPTASPTSSIGGGTAHGHTISTDGSHTHTFTGVAVADHTHTVATVPPYFALCYIMKL